MEKNRERTQKRLKRKKIVKIMVRLHFERVKVQAYFEIKFRSQSKGKLSHWKTEKGLARE